MADHKEAGDAIKDFLTRAREGVPMDDPRATAEVLAEIGTKAEHAEQARREQRLSDLKDGDVVVDPSLMDVGDEVAEETLTQFQKVYHGESLKLVEPKGTNQSRFSEAEQRTAAQRTSDLMLERGITWSAASQVVGAEIGMSAQAIRNWTEKFGLDTQAKARPRNERWNLDRREELFDRQLEIVSHLSDRMMVWLQDDTLAPEDWNAANEIKTIAVAAAILHDKRTGIEALRIDRGELDSDSEELQGGLDHGRQRLLEMNNGTQGDGQSRAGRTEAVSYEGQNTCEGQGPEGG